MKCYLIRHADAVPLGEGGIVDDASRPLTATGEKQCQLVGQGLARRGIRLDVLLTSPLVRARQTAVAVARHLAAPEVRDCPHLAPGGKRRKLVREIENADKEAVGVVGHQPDLGEFAGWLIGSKKAQIDLAKASVACIDFEEAMGKGDGKLLWIVTLEWLER